MRRYLLLFLATVALWAAMSACASDPKPDKAVLEDLAQTFMAELKDNILVHRNNPKAMAQQGVIVTDENTTTGIKQLADFYIAYNAGEDCQFTAAFYNTSPLAIIRVCFTPDGQGYYFRYELNEDEVIAVSTETMNRFEIVTSERAGTTTFNLYNNKKLLKGFVFKSLLVIAE